MYTWELEIVRVNQISQCPLHVGAGEDRVLPEQFSPSSGDVSVPQAAQGKHFTSHNYPHQNKGLYTILL